MVMVYVDAYFHSDSHSDSCLETQHLGFYVEPLQDSRLLLTENYLAYRFHFNFVNRKLETKDRVKEYKLSKNYLNMVQLNK